MEPKQGYEIFAVLLRCRCRFWRHDPAQPDLETKQFTAGTTHPHPTPSAQNEKSEHSHKSFIHPSFARTFVSSHFASRSLAAGSAKPPFQLPVVHAGRRARASSCPRRSSPPASLGGSRKTKQGCHSKRVGSGVAKVVTVVKVFKWQFLSRYIPFFDSVALGHPSRVLGYRNNHVIYVEVIGVKFSATSNSSHLAPSLGPRNI